MTGPAISVRGDARKTVEPDYAEMHSAITVTCGSKIEALKDAAAALTLLSSDLTALGGVALSIESQRSALTWSAHSATTNAEGEHDPQTGRYLLSGRISAHVSVVITARDFSLLDPLGGMLARHEPFAVHNVMWRVDWDNPGWPDVRADAIQAAIAKGRDYASALGSTLERVEHIADVGLLAGGDRMQMFEAESFSVAARGASAGGSDVPSLDPVPQELTATIEARFIASSVTLGPRP